MRVSFLLKLFKPDGATQKGVFNILVGFKAASILRELIHHETITKAHVQHNLALFCSLLEPPHMTLSLADARSGAHTDFVIGGERVGLKLNFKILCLFFTDDWKINETAKEA